MMTREASKSREQIQLLSLDDLVPPDHLVRKLEAALDWNFIYGMVEDKYSDDVGRPSIDPVVLVKLLVIQFSVHAHKSASRPSYYPHPA
jgi:transposase